jgi:hypothetical protein
MGSLLASASGKGYRLAFLEMPRRRCRGFRVLENPSAGRVLYVDDLVTMQTPLERCWVRLLAGSPTGLDQKARLD